MPQLLNLSSVCIGWQQLRFRSSLLFSIALATALLLSYCRFASGDDAAETIWDLAEAGQYEAAIKRIDELLAKDDLPPGDRAGYELDRVSILIQAEQYTVALQELEQQLLRTDLSDEQRQQYLIYQLNTLAATGDADRALELVDQHLALPDLSSQARTLLSEQRLALLVNTHRTTEAIQYSKEILNDPDLPEWKKIGFQLQRLSLLREAKQSETALQECTQYLNETSVPVQRNAFLMERAAVYDDLGQPELAAADRAEYAASQSTSHFEGDNIWLNGMVRIVDWIQRPWFAQHGLLDRAGRIGMLWGLLTGLCVYIGNRQRREGSGTWRRLIAVAASLSLLTLLPLILVWFATDWFEVTALAHAIGVASVATMYLVWVLLQNMRPPIRWLSGTEALPEAPEEITRRTNELAQAMHLAPLNVRVLPSTALAVEAFAGGSVAPSIVVADGILHRLQPTERDAVLAHELGHIANYSLWWFVLLRVGVALTTVAAAMWLNVDVILWGILLLIGAFNILSRWLEYDCDRRAAQVVGVPETIRALGKIHALHTIENQGWWSLLAYATATHPSRDARLSALAKHLPADVAIDRTLWDETGAQRSAQVSWLVATAWCLLLTSVVVPLPARGETVRWWGILIALWLPMFFRYQATRSDVAQANQAVARRSFWVMTIAVAVLMGFFRESIFRDGLSGVAIMVFIAVGAGFLIAWLRQRFTTNYPQQILQLLQQRRFEQVVELGTAQERAIQQNPEARHAVAVAKFLLHQDDAAVDDYEDLRDEFPTFEIGWQAFVLVLFELNDIQGAREVLDEEAEANHKNVVWNARMFDIYIKQHRPDDARAYLDFLRKELPNLPLHLISELKMAIELGDAEQAWEWAAKTDAALPGEAAVVVNKLRLAMTLGPHDRVPELFKEAEALASTNPFSLCERLLGRLRLEWESSQVIEDIDLAWVQE